MEKSVWQCNEGVKRFGELEGDIKTQVLIIGGGLCGILCAYYLKKSGIDCVVVEGRRIGSGTTEKSTAKITAQHGLIYDKLIKNSGVEKAQMYLNANLMALGEYKNLCQKFDCDFEIKDSYVYSTSNRGIIEKEVEAVNSLGFDAEFYDECKIPLAINGAIKFPDQAQFNPVKFINSMISDLTVYENTMIREIKPNKAYTSNGTITADKIIVTTHFPFINKHGSYFLKLYQHRSYVCAFEGVESVEGMYVDEDRKGISLRSYNDMLLIGGGAHRTGKKGGAWEDVKNFAKHHYPDAGLKYMWAAQDCMSLDSVPYIGKYSSSTPDLYVATGFNKWGITSSMISAMILRDMIKGENNEYEEVFSPQRSMLKPQLLVNGFETTVNLLTPTVKRCPHLGCALKWNKAEHTWDCPCHGSRFKEDGKLIDNPATGDLT